MPSRQPRSTLDPRCRAFLLVSLLAWSLGSCGRLPVAPEASHATVIGRDTPIIGVRTADVPLRAVIAQMASGVSGSEVADSYKSTMLDSIPELRIQLLRAPDGISTNTFIRRLQSDPRVVFAEPNKAVENAEARQSTIGFSEGFRTWPDVQDQTALVRVGAALAHQVGRGAGTLVAILDTGIDLDHPALVAALSLPGIESGISQSPGDDRPEQVDTNADGVVDGALGHGTHVAGIVHAIAPEAQLLPVRVLDSDGVGDVFRIARGLVLAVNRGAEVANLSLGMPELSRSIEAAVDYAHAAGVVVVAAAGNGGIGQLDFPANYPLVLAVAGTDPTDHKADFSNYGELVDVTAPSVGILSTYWDGTYARWSGTSMAAPFASGIAALAYGILGPPSVAQEAVVENLVRAGAQPLASIDQVYGGQLGAGRVSASASMRVFRRHESAGGSEFDPEPKRLYH